MSSVSTHWRTTASRARDHEPRSAGYRAAAPVSGRAQSFARPTSSAGLRSGRYGQVSLSCKRFESRLIGRLHQLRPSIALGRIPSVDHGRVVGLKSRDEPQAGLRLGLAGRPEQCPVHGGLILLGGRGGGSPATGHVQALALGVSRGGRLLDQALGLQLSGLRCRRSYDAEFICQFTAGDAVIAEDQPAYLCFEHSHVDVSSVVTRHTPACSILSMMRSSGTVISSIRPSRSERDGMVGR